MTERRSVVAIRHVAFEDLGLMAGLLDPDLFDVAYCEAATDDLSHRSIRAADLVIILGGPIGVGDARHYRFLSDEIALIESRLTRGKPTLGICLGAQLMAAALGDWHDDTFDCRATPAALPSMATTTTRPSRSAATRWRCNSIRRPTPGSSRNGMSAMPSN